MAYQRHDHAPEGVVVHNRPHDYVHDDHDDGEQKSLLTAYQLCFPMGWLGLPDFYLGRTWLGVYQLLTFGGLGIAWLLTFFDLPELVREANRAPHERAKYRMMDAYKLAVLPIGLPHLYLYGCGPAFVVRLLTFNFFGLGWLLDLFTIPTMVRQAREEEEEEDAALRPLSLGVAYLYLVPFGILGAHYTYLRKTWLFMVYFLTFGIFGFGFLADIFLLPGKVRRVNLERERERLLRKRRRVLEGAEEDPDGEAQQPLPYVEKYDLATAFVLWFPAGFLGLHRFYIGHTGVGWSLFFTFGLAVVGWLLDGPRLPTLVREANAKHRRLLDRDASGQHYGAAGAGVETSSAQHGGEPHGYVGVTPQEGEV